MATVLLLGSAPLCLSQCREVVWPEDSALAQRARKEVDRLANAKNMRDYRSATSALSWLARNAPRADTNLFRDADIIYGELLRRERNQTVKELYLDSIYRFYDFRARHCDKDLDVDEARALALYRHFVNIDPRQVKKALDSLISLKGEQASDRMLVAYMESVRTEYRKYDKLSEKEILAAYNTTIRVAEQKRSRVRRLRQSEETVARLMDDIDAILFSMIVVDCQFVKRILGPRFRAYPDDLMLARRIISLMLQNQCVDEPLWLQAAERIYIAQDQPDYTLAKSVGLRYFKGQNFGQARYYLSEAARLAPTPRDRSETLVLVGQIEGRTDKAKARSTFMAALEADKGNKEAYERIGDLYYNSEKSCAGDEPIAAMLVYLLAYDYYQRAGNGKKTAITREKFPTKEDLKRWGYTEGQQIAVECWIQETTTIRSRN